MFNHYLRKLPVLLVLVVVSCAAPSARAAELAIAAAANVKFALDELVAEFHKQQTEIRVNVAYGSSGNFFAQIQNHAPFDVFFSADMALPRELINNGFALDTNVFLYATGRIVVWVPSHSPVNVEKLGIQSLLAPAVKKVAIANPRVAPYGMAAVEAMKALNVYADVQSNLVFGENIMQTAQFVQSGNADIGILAMALAVAPEMRAYGRYWEIPMDAYPTVEQGGIILKRTKEPGAARAFRDFVLGRLGREVFDRYGFSLPDLE